MLFFPEEISLLRVVDGCEDGCEIDEKFFPHAAVRRIFTGNIFGHHRAIPISISWYLCYPLVLFEHDCDWV